MHFTESLSNQCIHNFEVQPHSKHCSIVINHVASYAPRDECTNSEARELLTRRRKQFGKLLCILLSLASSRSESQQESVEGWSAAPHPTRPFIARTYIYDSDQSFCWCADLRLARIAHPLSRSRRMSRSTKPERCTDVPLTDAMRSKDPEKWGRKNQDIVASAALEGPTSPTFGISSAAQVSHFHHAHTGALFFRLSHIAQPTPPIPKSYSSRVCCVP